MINLNQSLNPCDITTSNKMKNKIGIKHNNIFKNILITLFFEWIENYKEFTNVTFPV